MKTRVGCVQGRDEKADLVLVSVWHERSREVSQQGMCGGHG